MFIGLYAIYFIKKYNITFDSIKSGKIVCELKLNPEKYTTHEFYFKEIFSFQEKIIDEIIRMIERRRNIKKEN